MHNSELIRPIFIVGSERSGTTLLRLMLHAHPRIAIPPQTKYVKKLYKRRLLFGNLAREDNRQKLARWFLAHFDASTKLDDLDIDPAVVRSAVQATHSLGAALAQPLIAYAAKYDKLRWGDKRPYYIKYLDKLRTLFPDAQVIHLIRDCRDVVASLKHMPWWKSDTIYSILNWKEAIERGLEARQSTKLDEYLELRYEDLVDEPERELQRVCQFLSESYAPEMLHYSDIARYAVPDYKMAWHAATRQPLSRDSIERWKVELSAAEISLIEWSCGKELEAMGYTLSGSAAPDRRARSAFRFAGWSYRIKRCAIDTADSLISLIYRREMSYRKDGKTEPQL
ncbi:MAG: sulfotransferase [Candidatus Marinimicrobia bacterium]|nr:sulfotransferase [Candidatus Neomarinimicrobiota bacterium]MDP6593550.1 sulfotransferase [Candidatus Neomarinimicrobiota bacterium]MDP6837024.1 sulfotransferase [Candidatus Neomarinimicrobiota bacterium]